MNNQPERISRRGFITRSAKAALCAALLPAYIPGYASTAPSDRFRFALVGAKGVGWDNLMAMMNVEGTECLGICDLDQNVLEQRGKDYQKAFGRKAPVFTDFRKLLENKNVDGVIISTPDHWHTLQTLYALQAGKHVYVEKPLANSIYESQLLVKAVAKYGKKVQVGQQQRSAPHWHHAIDYLHTGNIGKVRTVKAWAYSHWKGAVPIVPDEPVPAGVDYDMWLGPAPARPFNRNHFHFTFRWFWEYAGGLMTDWGVHLIDIVLYGMKDANPKSVVASGGKYAFPDDAMQTPDTMVATYEFPDFLLVWEHTIGISNGPYNRTHGIAFIGEKGTLFVNRDGWEIIPEIEKEGVPRRYQTEMLPFQAKTGNDRIAHCQNFVEAVRKDVPLACDIQTGAHVSIVSHLGNLAYRTGTRVAWDAEKQQVLNNPAAEALIKPVYRSPWVLPAL